MAKIARIELFHVALPLAAHFYPSWIPGYPQTENRFDLIKITTSDGVEGYSAGPAMGKERAGLGDLLGPYLIGENPINIALIQQRLREIAYLGWQNHWIEPAFWDIKGKYEKKPVYELLGAKACPVMLYASTGEVKTAPKRIEEALARYEEGFRTIKIRVHDFDEAKDAHQVIETVKAVGDKMKVAVDANQGWRVTIVGDAPLWDYSRAKRFAAICADNNIAWLEEPLPMDSYDDLSKLTRESGVPIAGGEMTTSGLRELAHLINQRCYNIYQPDAILSGGIAQTFEAIKLCRQNNLLYSPHTWTNGIGFAVNLQLMVASGFADKMPLEYPVNPPGWTVESRDAILETPFIHNKGVIEPPQSPGLGISINKRILHKYGRRFFVMGPKRLVWHSIRTRGIKVSKEIDRAKRVDSSIVR